MYLEKFNKIDVERNKELLADVANFAMLEFMYPKHPDAHYAPTDSDKSPGLVGFGVAEMEEHSELIYPAGTEL